MRCQTGSFRLSGRALFVLLLLPCWCLTAFGAELEAAAAGSDGLCPANTGQEATVLKLDIVGTDLLIQLATTPALGHNFTVSLTQPEAAPLLQKATIGPADAPSTVTLRGVMQGAEDRDIRYFIEVADASGVPAMDPFPFSVLYECPSAKGCSYYPLAGVSTSGLLVTEDLYAQIAESTSCDLLGLLRKLRGGQDSAELAPDIDTLVGQLERLGVRPGAGKSCAFAWLTVVPIDQGFWSDEMLASPSPPGEELWEFGGGTAGASLCYTGQARSTSESFGRLTGEWRKGHSALSNTIRCVQAGAFCAQSCAGTVATDFSYNSCVIADAQGLGEGGRAEASTSLSLSLEVNTMSLLDLQQKVEVSAAFPDAVIDTKLVGKTLPTTTFVAPMAASIDAIGFFSAMTGPPTGISPALPPPPPSSLGAPTFREGLTPEPAFLAKTTAFAYTEGFDFFTFEALASSQCTLRGSVYSILQTPVADVLRKSGGIKIKRWADPP